ncbi:MAG: DUF4118 domain-containing protein [Bacteroidales bacterium]
MGSFSRLKLWKQFAFSIAIITAVSIICFILSDFVGYKNVSLILLFTVSVLSVLFTVWPVLVSAVLSVLVWDFFFIPPFLSFHPLTSEDGFMLSMYFIIVLLNGIFSSQIRQIEKQSMLKEEKLRNLGFYNTLFNSISHELRTPITTIIGVTENILNPETKISDKDRLDLNREVLIATEKLNQLIDNLLNMSRIESGVLMANKTWCDVSEIIYTAIDRLPENLKYKTINVNITNDMLLVKLDFGLMEQAVYNIIHNAVIHTPDTTVITISATLKNKTLEISIKDNGPGFVFCGHKNNMELMKKNKTEGLGLGLSIVNGFLVMHNGELKISNIDSGGTIVKFIIPVETIEWKDSYGE